MGQDGTITERLMDRQLYNRSRSVETLEYIIFVLLGIAIPLLLKQPQLLVGSTVNFVLIMTAIHVRGWSKVVSLIVLPSVSALLGSYLFGPFQIFLVYMLPFIWGGNALIVFLYKYLYVHKRMYFLLTLPVAALVKSAFIFCFALLWIKLSVIPPIAAPVYEVAMGHFQLITAVLGGCAAFLVNLVYQFVLTKNRSW